MQTYVKNCWTFSWEWASPPGDYTTLVSWPIPTNHSEAAYTFFSCPGRIFSYCVRARAYTHVLARVYSTRASTCTIYTCFTLPPTRVNPTGLQLSIFQNFGLLWPILEHLCCQTNFMVGLNRIETTLTLTLTTVEAISEKSWPCLICLQFIYLQTDHVMPPSLDFERE